ncbi:MAG TPA: type I 3-dehydroquinate dehydratase [Thermoanaerobaculia bacterium]|nr:type I 3-dehydroquinate dehydratase [Thermoanaerobaculia bacterium]
MPEATLVASLTSPSELRSLPAEVRCLEVRADLMGDLDPDGLRDRFRGELLYSLRSRAAGGADEISGRERRERLLAAAQRWDLIDLEASDLEPEVLARIPAARRVVSWRGPAMDLGALRTLWERFAGVEARLVRLVPAAEDAMDALAPLRLLREIGRSDVVAFASGPAGWWSRLLAPRLGAPFVFAAAGEEAGEPTAARLVDDYGLPDLPPVEALYGIVGRSATAAKSLSPRLHNASYRALGLPALYLPFPTRDFAAFWRELPEGLDGLGFRLAGLTVTSPHKEEALEAVEHRSRLAQQAAAANTLLRHNGSWRADTADAEGVLAVLGARGVGVAGRQVAVVGCGGAGRAAAAGLQQAGGKVTLVNRSLERGLYASSLLSLPFVPLAEFSAREFSLVVHATPLQHEIPFATDELRDGAVVVELVYGAAPTPLMTATAARGGVAIDGREVLLVEAQRQFQMMTGRPMPGDLAVRLIFGEGVAACANIPVRASSDGPSDLAAAFA